MRTILLTGLSMAIWRHQSSSAQHTGPAHSQALFALLHSNPTTWHAVGHPLLPLLGSYKTVHSSLNRPGCSVSLKLCSCCSLPWNASPLLPFPISATPTHRFRSSFSVDTSGKAPWYSCWDWPFPTLSPNYECDISPKVPLTSEALICLCICSHVQDGNC